MKKIILVFIMLSGGSVQASSAQAIYNAMNVEEQPLSADRAKLKYMKSAGGLSCIKTNSIRRVNGAGFADESEYECEINFSSIDSKEIYEILNSQEEALPAKRTELKFQKSVDKLRCIRTVLIGRVDINNVDCFYGF